MDIIERMDRIEIRDGVERAESVGSKTDAKIAKTLGYVVLSHIAVIGILYYGVMNFIVG